MRVGIGFSSLGLGFRRENGSASVSTVKAVECDRPAVEGAAMTTEDSSGSNSIPPV